MPAVESRLRDGKLTLGTGATPMDFTCQVTNARLKSNYNTSDGQETLCGDMVAGVTTFRGRSIAGTVIQDFDDPDGFIEYCFLNDLKQVVFSYQPNQTGAPTYGGTVTVQVPDDTSGGDVNARLTCDFEWQINGLTRAYPATPLRRDAFLPDREVDSYNRREADSGDGEADSSSTEQGSAEADSDAETPTTADV